MSQEDRQAELAALDRQLAELINRRCALTRGAAPDATPAAWSGDNPGPVPDDVLHAVFREIRAAAQALSRPLRIAYLGPEGTFTHQAALAHFGHSAHTDARPTIADIFDDVGKERVEFGVVPIENSTEGAVTDTYDMFYDHNVFISAEIHLTVHHHLMSQARLEDIEVVYSHPQVFGQCRGWIQQHLSHCALMEVTSTSAAAARAAREPRGAALAGTLAAERCGLPIRHENIEDLADNVTRFLALSRSCAPPTGDDKTSVMLAVRDRVGALYEALLPLKNNHVNMTLIHSRPSKRRNWDYHFFIDFLGHIEEPRNRRAVAELEQCCKFVKHLGSYPRRPHPVRL